MLGVGWVPANVPGVAPASIEGCLSSYLCSAFTIRKACIASKLFAQSPKALAADTRFVDNVAKQCHSMAGYSLCLAIFLDLDS